jgi:hypothetical protein
MPRNLKSGRCIEKAGKKYSKGNGPGPSCLEHNDGLLGACRRIPAVRQWFLDGSRRLRREALDDARQIRVGDHAR